MSDHANPLLATALSCLLRSPRGPTPTRSASTDATDEPSGLRCPGCRRRPSLVIDADLAICAQQGCRVVSWNPTRSLDELASDVHLVDLPGYWTG